MRAARNSSQGLESSNRGREGDRSGYPGLRETPNPDCMAQCRTGQAEKVVTELKPFVSQECLVACRSRRQVRSFVDTPNSAIVIAQLLACAETEHGRTYPVCLKNHAHAIYLRRCLHAAWGDIESAKSVFHAQKRRTGCHVSNQAELTLPALRACVGFDNAADTYFLNSLPGR